MRAVQRLEIDLSRIDPRVIQELLERLDSAGVARQEGDGECSSQGVDCRANTGSAGDLDYRFPDRFV